MVTRLEVVLYHYVPDLCIAWKEQRWLGWQAGHQYHCMSECRVCKVLGLLVTGRHDKVPEEKTSENPQLAPRPAVAEASAAPSAGVLAGLPAQMESGLRAPEAPADHAPAEQKVKHLAIASRLPAPS